MSEEEPILWYDDYIKDTFTEDPGLYDDVYMDLTFLEVMVENGIDASASIFAEKFAHADYKLWHANQAARYNILHGILPPDSGHWRNNPHADDIDFQIESDFIGMLYPGMVNSAVESCDKIGHIMNHGDGWYGGVFISAMYSLAYICDDIPTLIKESIDIIPKETKFRSCIDDVIKYHEKYPDDWKQCWFEVEKRHGYDIGCPEGVWNGFNIDAVINSAWVVIALLYGNGDFERTMEIATRCGQDSDCNPASAAGILGVVHGYSEIPEKYRKGAEAIADMAFPYTSLSLNETCKRNLDLMETVIADSEGIVSDTSFMVKVQRPRPVRWEQSFEGLRVVSKVVLKKRFSDSLALNFSGTSIVVEGSVVKTGHATCDYVAEIQIDIDGRPIEVIEMPYDYITRKYEIYSKYCLENGPHVLSLKILNPHPDFEVNAQEMVVYDEE